MKTDKRIFWILIIAMHVICFGKQLFYQTSYLQDSKEYLFAADNLIQNHVLYAWDLNEPFNPNWLTKRPILYPLILAVFKSISFGNYGIFLFIILLVQNIISLFTINSVKKIVDSITGNFNHKIAMCIILFTPAQAIYANLIMSEIWLQLVLVLSVNYLFFNKTGLTRMFILALLCIAAMALKPVMIFCAFCLPVYSLLTIKRNLKAFILSLVPLLYFLTVTIHNGYRTGYNQYSSISTINILQYNTYTLLINKYGVTKADSIVDNIRFNADNLHAYAAKQKYISAACREILINHWALYGYLHVRGAFFCLLDPGRFDITQFFNLKHESNLVYEINKKNNLTSMLHSFLNPLGLFLLLILISNGLKLYLGIRFLFANAVQLSGKLILLFFPCYILLFTGPIGSSRFAFPFFPIYLIMILIALKKNKTESNADSAL